MNVNCKLEILTDTEARYEGDYYDEDGYYRGKRRVEGKVGGNELMLRTVKCLNHLVAECEHCRREELVILGLHLYNIAFGSPHLAPGSDARSYPLKEAFEGAYRMFERQKKNDPSSRLRLMLVLHKEAQLLSTFPWEFIFMPKGEKGFFLAGQQTDLILTRFVPGTDAAHDFQTDHGRKKLRILIVLSEPKGMEIVKADELIRDLHALQPQQTTVDELRQPTRSTLKEKIGKFEPHIMHFIGHGKEGGLALIPDEKLIEEAEDENEDRQSRGQEPLPIEYADWLDSDSVLTLFDEHTPRLVFLHACQGAAPDLLARSLTSFSSTARDLAYTKIPAVIAMQYKISNDAAQRFAQKFYDEIRQGKHIDEAVVQARYVLGSSPTPGRQAWDERTFGTPVIYLRSEKPITIIQPPPPESEETESSKQTVTVRKAPCPYPDCGPDTWVIPGKKFCLTCRGPLMMCPNCRQVMAQAIGFCDECGYEEETSAQPARAAAIAAAPAAPAQPPQAPTGYDPETPDDHQPRIA